MTEITEPGVHDIPEDEYHADPVPEWSLSATGARKLLPPSCPALYLHERQHGRAPKREFDFGHAAHRHALGVGSELVVVDAENWRTKAAREERDAAYEAGKVPLLGHEHRVVVGMAEALRAHPVAGALFDPERGKPEQSLFWRDEPTGVWRRARLDWLPEPTEGGRMIVPDYKTTTSASPDALQREIARWGYAQQAAWYLDGVQALGLADDAAFVFVFQEKTEPYLVTVVELDAAALRIGRHLNRRALRVFRDCLANDHWPDHTDGQVRQIALPAYIENQYLEEVA